MSHRLIPIITIILLRWCGVKYVECSRQQFCVRSTTTQHCKLTLHIHVRCSFISLVLWWWKQKVTSNHGHLRKLINYQWFMILLTSYQWFVIHVHDSFSTKSQHSRVKSPFVFSRTTQSFSSKISNKPTKYYMMIQMMMMMMMMSMMMMMICAGSVDCVHWNTDCQLVFGLMTLNANQPCLS